MIEQFECFKGDGVTSSMGNGSRDTDSFSAHLFTLGELFYVNLQKIPFPQTYDYDRNLLVDIYAIKYWYKK